MGPEPLSKIERLLQTHFPWGQPGFPERREDLELEVSTWITRQLLERGCANTALALHSRLQAVLDEIVSGLPTDERNRLFYRSDLSHLVKSPASILDKMVRDWTPGPTGPRFSFANFLDEMEDLARFRLVLNFLSDVEGVGARIEEPFQCEPQARGRLTSAQRALFEDFGLKENCLRDLIHLPPKDRRSGERCRKGVFYPRNGPRISVEVQIQSMLEEAWDKKDHFLIYERRRRGEPVGTDHNIVMHAMSELLYVADLTFDRLLKGIRQQRGGGA